MASALGVFGTIPFVCSSSVVLTFKDLQVERTDRWATWTKAETRVHRRTTHQRELFRSAICHARSFTVGCVDFIQAGDAGA